MTPITVEKWDAYANDYFQWKGYRPVTFAKDQPEYIPLPALVSEDKERRVVTGWQLTWRERFRLLLTGKLFHSQLTFGQPLQPLMMGTEFHEVAQ